MLDSQMKDQLRGLFAPIQTEIGFIIKKSNNKAQSELAAMLEEIASLSENIKTIYSEVESPLPSFQIAVAGKPTGIIFSGIPGGHEFTSLILAILNAAGKGKATDPNTAARIQNLKGPIRLKTYISLTCETCPDVVQALNQMALLHPDFQHEMIDGAFTPEQIEKLGIQGVPSIIANEKLLHSGRITILDLITKLETTFGTQQTNFSMVNPDLGTFDVVVIGGGPAGASAAIYSARKGLKTAILAERFGGQVQDTKGIENLISIPYTEGPELAGHLREHLSAYPITLLEQRRVTSLDLANKDAKSTDKISPKKIQLESGEFLTAESIIVTTGAKWRELGVPGEKEYLGRGVAFCPHCDGPFYKGKKVAVIGGGNSGVEAAIDLAGIVKEVVLFEFMDQLKADQVLINKLKSLPNTSIVTSAKSKQVHGNGQKVTSLEYEDRKTEKIHQVDLDGIFVQIGLLPNSSFLKGQVEVTKFGEIIVDNKGRTSFPGVYAAGDVTTTPYKQIIIAMGEGAKAALAAFEDRMYTSVS
jgi:alkyl hydroperoxide reductase subunit F